MTDKSDVIKLPPFEQGLENEKMVLKAIRWFGHLRVSDLAKYIWANSPEKSGLECARRTCKKLMRKGLLIRRRNTYGSSSYVLSSAGAIMLSSLGYPASAGTSIQNVTGAFFRHRTMTTQYLLERKRLNPDEAVFGENAIAKNWFFIGKNDITQKYKKIPDGLVLVPGAKRSFTGEGDLVVDWIETEAAYKSMSELEKVLEIGWETGAFFDSGETVTLDRLVIVTDLQDRHEHAIIRAFHRVLKRKPLDEEGFKAVASSIYIVRANTGVEQHWNGYEEVCLIDAFKRFSTRKRSKLLDGLT